jgi:hypothetical protein
MAVTAKRARTLALSFEGASAYPHFDRIAFRTERRTFATLALDGVDLNFMCDLVEQQRLCELAPQAIAPVPGGWGRMGWTRIDLKKIDSATFTTVLKAAYARANAPRTRKKAPRATGTPRLVATTTTTTRKKPTRK